MLLPLPLLRWPLPPKISNGPLEEGQSVAAPIAGSADTNCVPVYGAHHSLRYCCLHCGVPARVPKKRVCHSERAVLEVASTTVRRSVDNPRKEAPESRCTQWVPVSARVVGCSVAAAVVAAALDIHCGPSLRGVSSAIDQLVVRT